MRRSAGSAAGSLPRELSLDGAVNAGLFDNRILLNTTATIFYARGWFSAVQATINRILRVVIGEPPLVL